MSKPTTKANEPTMSKTLDQRIADARRALQNALVRGDKTAQLREFLHELEAEQQKEIAAATEQQAAQAAAADSLKTMTELRIAEAAQQLLVARNNRLAAVRTELTVTRAVADVRS